ncbi:M15 family metallopeptidase [Nocardioides sp. ChNu-153]|uniref:M15 family metallopeptidase n=1 Tax=unclassified Nocardioides TaxID=2615069 RepID=UPI00240765CC|nr:MULTISPECIES: M15 family metallopeptidase [unclassified Nocardioides]MDF9714722.1 M15 family metallopeptidase [Nocardioides sp. ChNu-99]MDN7120150.1 M15 family metallopeptidase [Nocardioides sp. ChNu-153]
MSVSGPASPLSSRRRWRSPLRPRGTVAVTGLVVAALLVAPGVGYADATAPSAAAAPHAVTAETDPPASEPTEPTTPTEPAEPAAPSQPAQPAQPDAGATEPDAGAAEPDAPADPAAAAPARVTVSAPAGFKGDQVDVTIAVADADGAPLAGARVRVERFTYGKFAPVATLTTGADGTTTATVVVAAYSRDNVVRALFDSDGEHAGAIGEGRITLRQRRAVVELAAPTSVRDEHPLTLWYAVRDEARNPVTGTVEVHANDGSGYEVVAARAPLASNGGGKVVFKPRRGTKYRVVFRPQEWIAQGISPERWVNVAPYAPPVVLPSGAPRPTVYVPPAPRATIPGPAPEVLTIPNHIWADMVGRSWRPGCPVGRADLRLVRVNYLGFDGFRYRGEVVVHRSIATRTARMLSALHDGGIPIRSMVRPDGFGYSSRLRGADDYKSMAADNTSAFNCRGVVGNPSRRSPHSTGRSIDINPWENPYRSAQGAVPNTWWLSRSHPTVAWRSRSHRVVQILANHGFRWTYGLGDLHHFDG